MGPININKFLTSLLALVFVLPTLDSHAQIEQDFDLLLLVPIIAAQNGAPKSPLNKPGPSNTGVTLPLTPSGSITVNDDGAIIKDLEVDGCILIKANNVRIKNVRINCSSFYGINISSGYTGTLIEDVEIFGMLSSGILGSDFILRRANIHDSGGDATKPVSNAVIQDSWFHRLGSTVGSHSDGVQMVSGGNVIIRGNNFDMPHDLAGFTNSQCMIIQTNNGPIDDVLIENNWLNGGGWCVQINDKGNGYGPPTNVRILSNQFGRDCQFGLLRFKDSSPVTSGNVWEDTGESIDGENTDCNP